MCNPTKRSLFILPMLRTVSGPERAYSCATRTSKLLPAALPPVLLFAGKDIYRQQVLTIVNVAGQEAAGKMQTSPPWGLFESDLLPAEKPIPTFSPSISFGSSDHPACAILIMMLELDNAWQISRQSIH